MSISKWQAGHAYVAPIEVERETEHSVWVRRANGRVEMVRKSKFYGPFLFDSWEAARDHVVSQLVAEVNRLDAQMAHIKRDLDRARKLAKPSEVPA